MSPKTSTQKLSRRRTLIGLSTIGLLGTGVIARSDTAGASSVELDGLAIDDIDHHGEPETVTVNFTINAEWENADTLVLEAHAGRNDDAYSSVEHKEINLREDSGSDTFELSANILESAYFGQSEFELTIGQSRKDVDIYLQLDATLRRNGDAVTSETIDEKATVSIYPETAELSIGATGEWNVQ